MAGNIVSPLGCSPGVAGSPQGGERKTVFDLLLNYARAALGWLWARLAPASKPANGENTLTIGGNVRAGRDFVGRDHVERRGDDGKQ